MCVPTNNQQGYEYHKSCSMQRSNILNTCNALKRGNQYSSKITIVRLFWKGQLTCMGFSKSILVLYPWTSAQNPRFFGSSRLSSRRRCGRQTAHTWCTSSENSNSIFILQHWNASTQNPHTRAPENTPGVSSTELHSIIS